MNRDALGEVWSVTETEEIPSTNTALKELARRGAPAGTVLIARRQTAGRGRMGRSFYSPDGTGLYLSALLRPDCPPGEALNVTVAAAVAACKSGEQVCGNPLGIKWVNDLYRDGKKVCGILTEGETDPKTGRLNFVICGVGFNVCPPENGFPEELSAIAGSLCDRFDPSLRISLAGAFLKEFRQALTADPKAVIDEYRNRSILIGRSVFAPDGAFPGEATVLTVDGGGGLVLRFPDGTERTLTAGEVSVRLSPNKPEEPEVCV